MSPRMLSRWRLASLAWVGAAACGSVVVPEVSSDGGLRDAGRTDAAIVTDAGARDSGAERFDVTVLLQGSGSGSVESPSFDLTCAGDACTGEVAAGERVQLIAVAGVGSAFGEWSGICDGEGESCTVEVERDLALAVRFDRVFTLTVVAAGDGSGVVTSPGGAISCPDECISELVEGTTVQLTATPDEDVEFGAWSGDCAGTSPTCEVTLDRDRSVVASFDRDRVTLSVALAGDGLGTVTADLGPIDCPGTCSASYAVGETVTLTAAPDADVRFAGWFGACAGTESCIVTMEAARAVTATFELEREPLTVVLQGSGAGRVTSDIGGIDCPGACTEAYVRGAAVELTATASPGSRFAGWGGACSGTGTCNVTVSSATNVSAQFIARQALTVATVGSGAGVVTSLPLGIDCGATCVAQFDRGTSVMLTAQSNADAYFVGWSGDCVGTTPTCTTTLSADRGVTARFRARAVQVTAGTHHACAAFQDGTVRCWGRGDSGRLGYSSTVDVGDDAADDLSTMQVSVGGNAERVVAGTAHTCALLTGGSVRCWGDALNGQLGYGSSTTIGDDEPPAAAGPVSLAGNATSISSGSSHTCALLSGGSVRCWGYNFLGQLGLGTFGVGSNVGDNEVPSAVAAVSLGESAEEVACGGSHCCARLASGAVRCWGDNNRGQLGLGHTDRIGDDEVPSTAPPVMLGGTPTSLHAGSNALHGCAIFPPSNGYRCWGRGTDGQLSPAIAVDIGDNELPSTVAVTGSQYAQLCAAATHTCGRTTAGAVFCWGTNDYGEGTPALGSTGDLGAPAVDLTCGDQFNCAVLSTGGVRCWGRAHYGQLGYGSTQNVGDGVGPSILAAGDVPL